MPRRHQTKRLERRFVVAVMLISAAAIAAALHASPSLAPVAAAPSKADLHALASAPSKVAELVLPANGGSRLGVADGAVPDGTSVFDDTVPGVANLDPALRAALRRAASDAAAGGVRFVVNSGWRSAAYEDQLRADAVAKYGSEAQASRWVATGSTSPHVQGAAVDLGPSAAARWLAANGAAYGLCQVYANEPWHFELRAGAGATGCPALYADPTHDPRMQP